MATRPIHESFSEAQKGIVLETVVGSHAWGLADETSDVDLCGVFALPFPWTAGLTGAPKDLVSADGSSSYWEYAKTVPAVAPKK